MNNVAKYFQWLQVLIALGDKLPKILAALQALFDAISEALPKTPALPAPSGGLAFSTDVVAITVAEVDGTLIPAEVLEAETKVFALTAPAGTQQLGDGTNLRKLFDWLQSSQIGQAVFNMLVAVVLKKVAGV